MGKHYEDERFRSAVEEALRQIGQILDSRGKQQNVYQFWLDPPHFNSPWSSYYVRFSSVNKQGSRRHLLSIYFPSGYGVHENSRPEVSSYLNERDHNYQYLNALIDEIKQLFLPPSEDAAITEKLPAAKITIKNQYKRSDKSGGSVTQKQPAEEATEGRQNLRTYGEQEELQASQQATRAEETVHQPQVQSSHTRTQADDWPSGQEQLAVQREQPSMDKQAEQGAKREKSQYDKQFERHVDGRSARGEQRHQAGSGMLDTSVSSFHIKSKRTVQLPKESLPKLYQDIYSVRLRYFIQDAYRSSSRYGVGKRSFKLVILRSALDHIYQHAKADLNNERFGVLIGGASYDEQTAEYWVEIVDMIPAQKVSANIASVEVSSSEIHEINTKVDKVLDNTGGKVRKVGWYHTHPGHGIFMSGTDLNNQERFYSAPWNIAMVVDPRHDEFGVFYGPDAIPLSETSLRIISDDEAARAGSDAYQSWCTFRDATTLQIQQKKNLTETSRSHGTSSTTGFTPPMETKDPIASAAGGETTGQEVQLVPVSQPAQAPQETESAEIKEDSSIRQYTKEERALYAQTTQSLTDSPLKSKAQMEHNQSTPKVAALLWALSGSMATTILYLLFKLIAGSFKRKRRDIEPLLKASFLAEDDYRDGL